jgi:hypothetical protein
MFFRKFLVWCRRQYNLNRKNTLIKLISAFVFFAASSIVVDIYLPFGSIWMYLRTLLLIPISVSIFIIFYFLSLYLHDRKVSTDENWVPYRMRFSPSWRRRISAIVGALIFVFIYATGFRPGYTLVSSILASIVIALFAFMRTTKSEATREELNIPDLRDIKYNERKAELEAERAEALAEARRKKAEKTYKRWGVKTKDYSDDDEDSQKKD